MKAATTVGWVVVCVSLLMAANLLDIIRNWRKPPQLQLNASKLLGAEQAEIRKAGFIGKPKGKPVQPAQPKFHGLIVDKARKYGLPARLLDSVLFAESSYNPRAISKSGAIGLGQLTPIALKDIGFRGKPEDLYDPATNIDLTAQYLNKVRTIKKTTDPTEWYAGYSFGPYNKTPISPEYKRNFDRSWSRSTFR